MLKRNWRAFIALVCLATVCFSGTGYALEQPDSLATKPTATASPSRAGSALVTEPSVVSGQTFSSGIAPIATDTSGLATPSLLTYGKNFFPDLLGGTTHIFSKDNLPIFLTGSILAVMAATVDHADRNTKNYFQTRHPISGVSYDGDTIGQGYYHVGFGAALLAAGKLTDDKKLADTGVVALEALLINGIATEGLKYSTHRHRPNNGDYMSFPSGHTSSTATLAASISAMYDWDWKIAVPMYGLVAFVGASRIQDNMHYLSDVIAGATLGTLIGNSVANYHKEKDSSRGGLHVVSISPLLDKDIKGAVFTLKW